AKTLRLPGRTRLEGVRPVHRAIRVALRGHPHDPEGDQPGFPGKDLFQGIVVAATTAARRRDANRPGTGSDLSREPGSEDALFETRGDVEEVDGGPAVRAAQVVGDCLPRHCHTLAS